MRKLTLIDDLRQIKSVDDVISFCNEKSIQFPDPFIEFMLNCEGSTIKEYVFRHGDEWSAINQVLHLRKNPNSLSIEDCLEIFNAEIQHWVPFANDPGGWLFFISLEKETIGQVWVLSTSAEKKMVAPNFIEFINGLMTFDEAVAKGY